MEKLSFSQARECVFNIYEKRGYEQTKLFVEFLSSMDLIILPDRANLSEMLVHLEAAEEQKRIEKRERKKLKKKLK